MEWQRELFREKNFRDVYRVARSFAGGRHDKWILFFLFFALSAVNVAWWHLSKDADPSATVIAAVRLWAESGVSFATNILGFLLAGFAIFASVTKADLFIALANIQYKKSDISRLKYVFFNFLIVFIHYLTFLSFCLVVQLFLAEESPLTRLLGIATGDRLVTRFIVAATATGIIGTWFIALILMLKVFIWNLYQSVLLAITTEEEIRKLEEKKKQIEEDRQ
ncbi:MAG: hypothetical protein AB2793_12705 [Candidatus Thiodiazotropha sp.]